MPAPVTGRRAGVGVGRVVLVSGSVSDPRYGNAQCTPVRWAGCDAQEPMDRRMGCPEPCIGGVSPKTASYNSWTRWAREKVPYSGPWGLRTSGARAPALRPVAYRHALPPPPRCQGVLKSGRDRGGGHAPLPVSPSPKGDIPTEAVFGLSDGYCRYARRMAKILYLTDSQHYEDSRMQPLIAAELNPSRSWSMSGTHAILFLSCTFSPHSPTKPPISPDLQHSL